MLIFLPDSSDFRVPFIVALRFDSGQNRRQFAASQFDPAVGRLRDMKAAAFEPFHPDHKAAVFPLQQLHQLFVAAEKGEHVSGFRILN